MSSANIETSKLRLQKALSLLEKTVERKLSAAKTSAADGGAALSGVPEAEHALVTQELEQANKENRHLREENRNLQVMVGKEKENNTSLQETHQQVLKRLDGVIQKVEQAAKKEAA